MRPWLARVNYWETGGDCVHVQKMSLHLECQLGSVCPASW